MQISNKENQKNEEFNLLDKTERDLFILMQSAVKTSHEKEKIHTNSAKYWSIVGSLAGIFIFFVSFDQIEKKKNVFFSNLLFVEFH